MASAFSFLRGLLAGLMQKLVRARATNAAATAALAIRMRSAWLSGADGGDPACVRWRGGAGLRQ